MYIMYNIDYNKKIVCGYQTSMPSYKQILLGSFAFVRVLGGDE